MHREIHSVCRAIGEFVTGGPPTLGSPMVIVPCGVMLSIPEFISYLVTLSIDLIP